MNKMNNKIFIGLGCCVLFSILFIYHSKEEIVVNTAWFHSINITRDHSLPLNRSIFFLETSHINKNEIELNARQCCAVESAALMNPTMKIHLLIFTQSMIYTDDTMKYVTYLRSYENIIIEHVNIEKYIKNTSLDKWWNKTNVLKVSNWPIAHVSDILRLLTIWKFGGIYFDLDVVIKSSFEGISNFVGAEDTNTIANGIFGFEKTGIGYQVIEACLQELMMNFRGDMWAQNGPRVITVVLKRLCNSEYINTMTYDRCNGITVFPPSIFYPIHWTKWEEYFDGNYQNNTMKHIDEALVIHVWNKLSSSKIIKAGSNVPYAQIANKYCPKIYNNCGETF